MFFSTYKIFLPILDAKYYNLTVLQLFVNICYLFEETNPILIIHNFSIATYDDIIHIGDDVNEYPV